MEKRKKLSDAMKSISQTGEVERDTKEQESPDRFSARENYAVAVYGPPEVFGLPSVLSSEYHVTDEPGSSLDPEEFDPPENCEPDEYGPPEMFFDPEETQDESANE